MSGTGTGWNGILDDAALFPPGNAPMADAVPAHHGYRNTWFAGLVGPFLLPLGRWAELTAHLGNRPTPDNRPTDNRPTPGPTPGPMPDNGRTLDVGLIFPGERLAEALRLAVAEPRITLVSVEIAPSDLPPGELVDALDARLPERVGASVELPRDESWPATLDALAGTRYRAKLRTGGTEAAAFPTEVRVAEVLTGCQARGVAVKCTAGLHHAVRHSDPRTGFEHHGYLNILLAAEAAQRGAGPTEVAGVLAERDRDAVAGAVRELGDGRLRAARALFTSFGTCSISEPVDDLRALHILDASSEVTR